MASYSITPIPVYGGNFDNLDDYGRWAVCQITNSVFAISYIQETPGLTFLRFVTTNGLLAPSLSDQYIIASTPLISEYRLEKLDDSRLILIYNVNSSWVYQIIEFSGTTVTAIQPRTNFVAGLPSSIADWDYHRINNNRFNIVTNQGFIRCNWDGSSVTALTTITGIAAANRGYSFPIFGSPNSLYVWSNNAAYNSGTLGTTARAQVVSGATATLSAPTLTALTPIFSTQIYAGAVSSGRSFVAGTRDLGRVFTGSWGASTLSYSNATAGAMIQTTGYPINNQYFFTVHRSSNISDIYTRVHKYVSNTAIDTSPNTNLSAGGIITSSGGANITSLWRKMYKVSDTTFVYWYSTVSPRAISYQVVYEDIVLPP